MTVPADSRVITPGGSALVTGASSGIGRELSLALGRRGVKLALVARRLPELELLATELIETGAPRPLLLDCDVADRARVEECAAMLERELGAVDLLVNNAGYGHHRSFLDWDLDDMERMIRVNYLGSLYWTRLLLPAMVARGRGRLVFVSSVAGRLAVPGESAYAASKFALSGLAEALSLELEGSGVSVLTVYPGTVRTAFFDDEAMAAMPAVAKRNMVETSELVEQVLAAIESGRRELTWPRFIAAGYVLRALLPALFRRSVLRSTS